MIWLPGHLRTGRPTPQSSDRQDGRGGTIDANDGQLPPEATADDERYRLISIDAVDAPEGCTGSDWHIYRIAQGENGITGYRAGDLARVTAEVETIVTALNERRQWTSRAVSKHQRGARRATAR